MGDVLKKRLSPGDICAQGGGLTHKNRLFLVIDVKEQAETALVVPVTTDHNTGSRIILINHKKYRARVVFPMELPLITLTVVPELQLDNLQETLTKLQRNLHPEEKNNLTQTTSAEKQAIQERGKTSASSKVLPSGTICILNDKCKDKRLLAINARYFLILESDGKTVNAVPLYYNTKSKNLAIKINGVAFFVLTNSSVPIPLNSISVIEKMKLDGPEKIIEKIKIKQCNPPNKSGKNKQRPILEQDKINPFPYLPIQLGDICRSKADSSPKPEIYYLVLGCRSGKEAIVAPIRKTNKDEEVSEKIIINNETFWIDVLARQDFPIALLTAVSHNHGEVVKRVIRKKPLFKTKEKTQRQMLYHADLTLEADTKETPAQKKRTAQKQTDLPKKEDAQRRAIVREKKVDPKQAPVNPTANKILYIYKGRISCHRQGHPIIPATATFLAEMVKK